MRLLSLIMRLIRSPSLPSSSPLPLSLPQVHKHVRKPSLQWPLSATALHPPSSPPTFFRTLRRYQEYQSHRQGLGRWTRQFCSEMNSWIVALSRCKVLGHANRSHSLAILVYADLLLLIFKASRPMNGYSRMLPPSPLSTFLSFHYIYIYPNSSLLRLSSTDTAFGYPYGPKISACPLPPLLLAPCESPTSLLSIT